MIEGIAELQPLLIQSIFGLSDLQQVRLQGSVMAMAGLRWRSRGQTG